MTGECGNSGKDAATGIVPDAASGSVPHDVSEKILQITALSQGPVSVEFLVRATGDLQNVIESALADLVDSGAFVRDETGAKFDFRHNSYRSQVVRNLPPAVKKFRHQGIARTLISIFHETGMIDWFHVAFHSLQAESRDAMKHAIPAIRINFAMGRDKYAEKLLEMIRSNPNLPLNIEDQIDVLLSEIGGLILQSAYHSVISRLEGFSSTDANVPDWKKRLLEFWGILARWEVTPQFPVIAELERLMSEPGGMHPAVQSRCLEFRIRLELQLGFPYSARNELDTLFRIVSAAPDSKLFLPGDPSLGRVESLAGVCALLEGDISRADRYFSRSLRRLRHSVFRDEIAETILFVGMLHYARGEIAKARNKVRFARKILTGIQRPYLSMRLLISLVRFDLDTGDLESAQAGLNLLQQDGELPDQYAAEVLFYYLKIALRMNRKEDVRKNCELLLQKASRFSVGLTCEILSVLPEISNNIGLNLPKYLEECRNRIQLAIGDEAEHPLVSAISLRLSSGAGEKDILETFSLCVKHALGTGDILSLAHLLIWALKHKISGNTYRQLDYDAILKSVDQPLRRELQSDILYYRGMYALENPNEFKDTDHLALLIRSRDIAAFIKDIVRKNRAANAIGSIVGPEAVIADVKSESEPDYAKFMDRLLAVQSVPELFSVAQTIFRDAFGFHSGKIIQSDNRIREEGFSWGKRMALPRQRITIREMERTIRGMIPIQLLDSYRMVLNYQNSAGENYFLVLWDCSEMQWRRMAAHRSGLQKICRALLVSFQRLHVMNITVSRYAPARRRHREPVALQGIIGCSEGIESIRRLIHRIKDSPTSVHIKGETGVGKELVARTIHEAGNRKDGPFVAYNCGASPENLIESELFGHVKGAFTGAHQARSGVFQAASGGTLFLDEVAELPLNMQVKLLRALQERKVKPVGADFEKPVDIRLLSATNKNLADEVEAGRFRSDLYFRLMLLEIEIPPLRDRPEDIPLLVTYFLEHLSERLGIRVKNVSEEALAALMKYQWPGNIRELQNVIEVGMNLCVPGNVIQIEHVIQRLQFGHSAQKLETLAEFTARNERAFLVRMLQYNHWNMTGTAAILGISRQGLFKKMRSYSIIKPGKEFVKQRKGRG